MSRYKIQEVQKDNTELKLKIDVLNSTSSGLGAEKKHLTLELKETKELLVVYEGKTKSQMAELSKVTNELQENKIHMIGFEEVQREREEKISGLKHELSELKVKHEHLDTNHCTLSINHKNLTEQYSALKRDCDDAVDKLHHMNKARYDLETRVSDEIERNKNMNEVAKIKDE